MPKSNVTRGGVYYNLKESVFHAIVEYPNQVIDYVFSSITNLARFNKKMKENRAEINGSISHRFKVDTELNALSDIVLYTKVEKRGFLLILENGDEIICQKDIILNGEQVMKKI